MNEKEILIQNATNAMPVAQQLFPIEQEIIQLESIVYKHQYTIGLLVKIFIIVAIFPYFMQSIADDLMEYGASGFIPVIFYLAVFGAIVFFLFFLGPIRKSKAQKKLLVLQAQWREIANDERLSWLPESYRRGNCAIAIYNYAINGRADSLKEALNLYEIEKHQERVEFAAMLGAYNGAH